MGCGGEGSPASNTTTGAPTVTTSVVTAVAKTTATSGGLITSDGGSTVTARGVCWSVNQNPTITDSKTSDSSGVGLYTSNLTGLTENTTYNVRAYATNGNGTSYGSSISFKTLSSTSGWTKLSTTNFPSMYPSRIQFVDANTGFVGITPYQSTFPVVGRTTDGGATWTNLTANCPLGSNYSSFWVNATTGYLSASKFIYKSTDAGNTWTQVGSITYPDITAMYFTDVNTGYLVANTNYGISFKTTNGGVTWAAMDTLFGARTMRFANASKGFACTDSWLGVTSNGAATWELFNFPGKIFRDLSVVDANTVYTVGDNLLLKKTTDGGATWSDVAHNIPRGTFGMDFNAVFFTSANEGWISTTDGIYHTEDAGMTWSKELALSGSHYGIWMINNQKGFVCSYTNNGSMYVYNK